MKIKKIVKKIWVAALVLIMTAGAGSMAKAQNLAAADTAAVKGSSQDMPIKMEKVTAVRLVDALSGWTGGEGWIARTDNGGKAWKVQLKSVGTVVQLFALNGKDAWAVFETGTGAAAKCSLFQTLDGGGNWKSVGVMPKQGFLHFVSKSEAFVANAYSSDGGKTWVKHSLPKAAIGEAYFHDKNNGWVVTADNKRFAVMRTVDGGKSWKQVMARSTLEKLCGAVIRSAGNNDVWVECIGGSGMSQTSYSLFHSSDGGKNWRTVIANSTAGAGPAPGFSMNTGSLPHNTGSKPGPLYVVDTKTAYMGGYSPAADKANTIGWTNDGGKTWHNGAAAFEGYSGALLAMADSKNGWWICMNTDEPSVMYTTSDGGAHWNKVFVF